MARRSTEWPGKAGYTAGIMPQTSASRRRAKPASASHDAVPSADQTVAKPARAAPRNRRSTLASDHADDLGHGHDHEHAHEPEGSAKPPGVTAKTAARATRASGRKAAALHAHDHDVPDAHDHAHDHHHAHAGEPASGRRKRPGIYLMSPAGVIEDPDCLDRAQANLKTLGYATKVDRTALARDQRFAGTDEQRLAAFQRAVRQPHDIVMAVRGGYGMSRLLHRIDWQAMADSGKRFVGHSDFTAFQLALLAKTGAVSYAGPMARPDFGGKRVDALTGEIFGEVMRGELEILSFEAPDADPVDARGVLWGGNLALVASLVGTPYLPRIRQGILFLEDVGEAPYRVERMLLQLLHAGVLARQKAILLGRFTEYRTTPLDGGFDLPAVVAWIRRETGVPVITGLPFGHVPGKVTLPIGARVGVGTEDGMAYLLLHEH